MRNRGQAQPESAPHPRIPVLAVVPSEDGSVNWSIARMFGQMGEANRLPDCPFTFEFWVMPGVKPIEYARNLIVDRMLAGPYQWLIMVDADQVVPENFWELMRVVDADVVSGWTNCWVGNGYLPGRLRVNQYGLIQRENVEFPECFNLFPSPEDSKRPYVVPIVGTGCVAIRRHVLEALGPNCFRFTHRVNGSIMGGEDVNFSQACNQVGFVISAHPGVKFGHMKTVDLAQVDEYAAARVKFEQEGRKHDPIDVLSIGA